MFGSRQPSSRKFLCIFPVFPFLPAGGAGRRAKFRGIAMQGGRVEKSLFIPCRRRMSNAEKYTTTCTRHSGIAFYVSNLPTCTSGLVVVVWTTDVRRVPVGFHDPNLRVGVYIPK